jgi:hypothetical protein
VGEVQRAVSVWPDECDRGTSGARDRAETMKLIYAGSGGVQLDWRFLGASSSSLATGSPAAA